MSTVVLVPYDQLSRHHGALADASAASHEILMIDSDRMLRSRTWHAQRLHLLLSAAAHLRSDLEAEGFTVHHRRATTLADGIAAFRRERPEARIVATEPTSHPLQRALARLDVELVPDTHFLTSREQFAAWASGQNSLVAERFTRWQRTRLDLLMTDGQPVGGQWNLDAENRLPPPRGAHPWPEPLRHALDDLDREVWQRIVADALPVVGSPPDGTWPTTRAAALRQLAHFLDHGLAGFGPYEDAMPSDTWSAYHSLLSPALNIQLLSPREVVDAAIARYEAGGIPLQSVEGFVRQIAGWREYVNGVYWLWPDEYAERNDLQADQPLPAAFDDPSRTQMSCVRSIVGDVHERGWVHHIPRLMVLANLALIAGVEPRQLLGWMRRVFVDAADWVMVPNVIGMGTHADGGEMMTKPYAGGGAYIKRMGRYCGTCPYDPGKRSGDDACPFTTLYWDFLDRHADRFRGNHRMARQVNGLARLSDVPELRGRAQDVLRGLREGTI